MKFLLTILFFLFSYALEAQSPFSIYLIGDAGEDKEPGKALLVLKEQLLKDSNSVVIFLGDNAYPAGVKKGDRDSELHLESQLQILKEYKGRVYFIPGNHDWAAQKASGAKTLANQERFVKEYLSKTSVANPFTSFLPSNGLPGPETIMLNDKLRVIFIDTQWFLHFYKKNTVVSKKYTNEIFYSGLDSLLKVAKENQEQVLIVAHHPMYSNGKHSRSLQPLRFLVNYTPLQVFGLLGLNRLFSQDIPQPRYKKMKRKMLATINRYDNIVFASGHEHNLQYFKYGTNSFVVSGSGSKVSGLRKKKKYDSIYQDDNGTGFFKLEYGGGEPKLKVFKAGEKEKEIVE